MKKIAWIVAGVFLFAGVAAAGPLERFYKAADENKLIDMDESDVAVLEFESNPSTGYGWHTQEDMGQHVRIIKREFVPDNPGMPGTSGVERIYLVAQTKGQADMTFDYKRTFGKKDRIRSHKFRFNAKRRFKGNWLSYYQTAALPQATAPETEAELSSTPSATYALPASYNWCDAHGGCPAVKNQGQCGACWAFATIGPLEALVKAAHGVEVNLSEQYLVSCNGEGWGCRGGWWIHEYLVDTYVRGEFEAGAVLESVMPYKSADTTCNPPHAKAYRGIGHGWLGGYNGPGHKANTNELKQAILDYGPITVNVCVNNDWANYSGGVYQGSYCPTSNHGVVLVGWDDKNSCWIMRNSWGPDWGEKGYMRIRYGVNNIGDDAAYIVYPLDEDGANGGGGDGGDDNDNSCQNFTATNSQHVSAGRAYTRQIGGGCTGVVTFYYALGSNANLGTSGSTTNSLYTNDGGQSYSVGTCP